MNRIIITTSHGSIRNQFVEGPEIFAVYGNPQNADHPLEEHDEPLLGFVLSEAAARAYEQQRRDQRITWEPFRVVEDARPDAIREVFVLVAGYLYDTPDGLNPDIRGVCATQDEARRWFTIDPDLTIWRVPIGHLDPRPMQWPVQWEELTSAADERYRASFRSSHPLSKTTEPRS